MGYGEGYSLSDLATAAGNGNRSGFGDGNGAWWIIMFLIFAMRGNGFNNGGSGAADNYVLASDFATLQRQLSDGFQSVSSGINQVNNGLCNGFYQEAQLINGVNMNIAQNGYESRLATQELASQLAQCCCDIRQGISGVNYNMAINTNALQAAMCNNTRDIVDVINNSYRSLHDEMVANRMEDKNTRISELTQRNAALELAASQANQTNYITDTILDRLSPCPRPAYLTCNPNQSIPVQYVATGNNCGCNTNCGSY